MKTNLFFLTIRPVAIFFIGLGALTGCSSHSDNEEVNAAQALAVKVDTVAKAESYLSKVTYSGRVEAPQRSQIGFQIEGELKQILVAEGDFVIAGQELARLDTDRLNAMRDQAKAQWQEAVAQEQLMVSNLKRAKEVIAFNGVSEQQLDEAQRNETAAKAAVAGALAQLNSIEVDLKNSRLIAPYDAHIIEKNADVGDIIARSQHVLTLETSNALEARVGVAPSAAQGLEIGQQHRLRVNSIELEGTLIGIVPSRNPVTRTIDLRLSIPSESGFPGDLVQLSLEKENQTPGFWLPMSALLEGNRGLWSVFVPQPIEADTDTDNQGATHQLSRRALEVLHQDGEALFVRGALFDGEQFVTSGVHRVVPGQLVRLQPDSF